MKSFLLVIVSVLSISCIAQDLEPETIELWASEAGALQFISGEAEEGVTYKYMSFNFKDSSEQMVASSPNFKAIEIFNREFLDLLTKNLNEAIAKSNQQLSNSWTLKGKKQITVRDSTEFIYLYNDTNSTYFTAEEGKKLVDVLTKEAHRIE